MKTPEPGTTLAGKYLVERVLGAGGMGVVVAAMHLELDQRVAIKLLHPDALRNAEVVERFAREAKAAAKIRGEHVARVIDVGRFDDGSPFMVMEYLEGTDLGRHLVDHGPLPVADAVHYVIEACQALAEAHAAKIVHRDLKPANLFLAQRPDKRSIIKVLDFGISKVADAASAALTKTSALMGTAFYMSPEQLTTPKDVDHRSDIWALGVILYELLTGTPPFNGESVPEVIAGILQNRPASLVERRPEVPAGLAHVVSSCMQSRPSDRYADVAELAEALAPFAGEVNRSSVTAISRVLGRPERAPATAPAPSVQGTLVMASSPSSPAMRAAPSKSDPEIAPSLPDHPPTMPSAAAVTALGLASSSFDASAKRSPARLFGGIAAVLVVVGGAGAVVAARARATSAEAPRGIVAPPSETSAAPARMDMPPPPDPPKLEPLVAAPSPSASAAPVPSAAPPAPAAAPRPTSAAAAAKPARPAPATTSPATTATTAAIATATAVPTAPATAAAPSPPSNAPKNPFDVRLK